MSKSRPSEDDAARPARLPLGPLLEAVARRLPESPRQLLAADLLEVVLIANPEMIVHGATWRDIPEMAEACMRAAGVIYPEPPRSAAAYPESDDRFIGPQPAGKEDAGDPSELLREIVDRCMGPYSRYRGGAGERVHGLWHSEGHSPGCLGCRIEDALSREMVYANDLRTEEKEADAPELSPDVLADLKRALAACAEDNADVQGNPSPVRGFDSSGRQRVGPHGGSGADPRRSLPPPELPHSYSTASEAEKEGLV